MLAADVGGDHLPVIATGDDALAVGRRWTRIAPAWMATRRLDLRRREQQRFLAEHEHRRLSEKMHADHGAAGLHRADAVGEGGELGALGVASRQAVRRPQNPRGFCLPADCGR